MTKRALVPIADGSEEIEAVCIIDTLRRAEVEVTVASVSDNLEITASRKTKLLADSLISACADQTFDLIALPGGIPGAEHLRDSPLLIEMLKAQRDAGRFYAAICASPAVALLPHGLLNGRRATCYPSYREQLVEVPNIAAALDRVVVDGNLITSQGPGTALEFALKLVECLFDDPEKATKISEQMLVR